LPNRTCNGATNIELPGHFLNRSGFLRADRRTKQRNQTFKFGVITFGSDRRLCVVKNISPTGAMIELENTLEIPDEFTLAIEADAFTHVCRAAWKRPKQIAVNYVATRQTDRRRVYLDKIFPAKFEAPF
jgi:hypothetical protein